MSMGGFQTDFIKNYLKSALDKGVKEGSRTIVEELAEGLSEDHLTKLIDILATVRSKKVMARTVEVKQVK
jgi:hypothetical protein